MEKGNHLHQQSCQSAYPAFRIIEEFDFFDENRTGPVAVHMVPVLLINSPPKETEGEDQSEEESQQNPNRSEEEARVFPSQTTEPEPADHGGADGKGEIGEEVAAAAVTTMNGSVQARSS